jgi:hypothetical protein
MSTRASHFFIPEHEALFRAIIPCFPNANDPGEPGADDIGNRDVHE